MKILIADDEREARELLLHYLRPSAPFVIRECADGKEALALLQNFAPDVLFLDVKMPERSGMEVMQQLSGAPLPAVVFTTAYDDYALPAFDYEVVDYLLKPFERERFDKALKRATDYVRYVRSKAAQPYLAHLSVKTGSKTDVVPLGEVLYFEAGGAYVQAVAGTRSFLLTLPVYELEARLDPAAFLRIHRSIIVRLEAVQAVHSLPNGDFVAVLKNGKELRGSRTYRQRVKEALER